MRPLRWLQTTPGMLSPAGGCELKWAFGIDFTNDYLLRITPFIYRPDTNLVNAQLVEFQPIKVKLLSNGKVEKLDADP